MATTLKNGLLPPELLTETSGGRVLRRNAAASYERTNAAFKKKFGKSLAFNAGWTGYRTLEQQQYLYDKLGYPYANYPGQSNHGWGLAMDVDLQPYGSAEWKWMNSTGRTYGWEPLNENNLSFEPWHWAYDQSKDQHIPAPEPEPEEDPVTVVITGPKVSYPKDTPGQRVGTVNAGSGETNWTLIDFDSTTARDNVIVDSRDVPRGGLFDVKFSLANVPVGATVQTRIVRRDAGPDGPVGDRVEYEIVERIGTDGNTSIDFFQTFGRPSPDAPATVTRYYVETQVIIPAGKTAAPEVRAARVIISAY
jgi:hypothetical protein